MKRSESALLTARGVTVWFRVGEETVKAVDGVDISVHRGERVGIVGESGSGKSVLCRTLAGLTPSVEILKKIGTIEFESTNLMTLAPREWRDFRRSGAMSMVFQDPLHYLNPTMRVGAQIAEAISEKTTSEEKKRRIEELLEAVGLSRNARVELKYPHELSGGMRQRVLMALALSNSPKLLIADEPTTALDLTIQAEVLTTLDRLQRESQMAFLLITHDLSVVAEMCDRVYVMYKGKVVEEAAVIDLFRNPRHSYTQKLIDSFKLSK